MGAWKRAPHFENNFPWVQREFILIPLGYVIWVFRRVLTNRRILSFITVSTLDLTKFA